MSDPVVEAAERARVEPAEPAEPVKPAEPACASKQFVFGSLRLTAEQVKKSRMLANLAGLDGSSDQSDGLEERVVDVAGWPGCVVEATKWLDMWFNCFSASYVCKMHGMAALDQLLAAANWLDMHECVVEIVKASCAASKGARELAGPYTADIYDQLVGRADFAPVSLDWPNMAELCWLLHAMPTILGRKLEKMWISKMTGIKELFLVDKQMIDSDGKVLCDVPTEAIVGADWYGVACCSDGCCLIKSNAARYQQHIQLCCSTPVGGVADLGVDVVASSAGQSGYLAVSPCQKYILWRCSNNNGMVNMVICLETYCAVEMPDQARHASAMWWLGDDQLAYRPPGHNVLHFARPADMSSVFAVFGSAAAESPAYTVTTIKHIAGKTMVTVCNRQTLCSKMHFFDEPFSVVCADKRDSRGRSFVVEFRDGHNTLQVDQHLDAQLFQKISSAEMSAVQRKRLWKVGSWRPR